MKRILPSVLTIGNICCGFLAVAVGDIFLGSIFLLIGIFLDTFDGLLARAFNAQSEMGKELDSLADMISFGIAPAYLYFLISPIDHWVSFIPPIFYVIGSAIRLAKYNTLPPTDHFRGLPTPFASLFLVGIFIGMQYNKDFFIKTIDSNLIYFLIPFLLMILMISNIKMFSVKSLNKGWSGNKLVFTCVFIFIVFLIIDFRIAFSAIVVVYILLSILSSLRIKS